MTVYYKYDNDNCYYTNEQKSDYAVYSKDSWAGGNSPANGRYVTVELYNNKFVLPEDSSDLFLGAKNTTFNADKWDTSNVTNLSDLFAMCVQLTEVDVSNWDTSNVTNMSSLFHQCYSLHTINGIERLNTSNVAYLISTFNGCSSLTSIDISSWDTKNVISMKNTFKGCSGLISISIYGIDTSNVTDMTGLFTGCSSITKIDLSTIDTSNVTLFSSMFQDCSNLIALDVSNFDVSSGLDFAYMFNNCNNLEAIYAKTNTNWYRDCAIPDSDPQKWTSSLYMFDNCYKLPGYPHANRLYYCNNTEDNFSQFFAGRLFWECDMFEKDLGSWAQVHIYIKDSESWIETEVYM